MRFKDELIKPPVMIHCPTKEEANTLVTNLKRLNISCGDIIEEYYAEGSVDYFIIYKGNWVSVSSNPEQPGIINIEFSDLVDSDDNTALPETPAERPGRGEEPSDGKPGPDPHTDPDMTARELLKWMDENKGFNRAMQKIFNGYYSIGDVFDNYSADDIIQRITEYEVAKKAVKPVETEDGWHCEISCPDGSIESYDLWNATEESARDDAAGKAKAYTAETGKQATVSIRYTCRVKEGES